MKYFQYFYIYTYCALEYLENLMWKKFTKKMKDETTRKGIYHLKHGNYEYPISLQLIKYRDLAQI